MSFRKKQLIQERNIFLEKMYLKEQTQPVQPPTTELKVTPQMIKDKIKTDTFCSKQPQKIETQKNEIMVDGKKYNYYLTKDNKGILCIDEVK